MNQRKQPKMAGTLEGILFGDTFPISNRSFIPGKEQRKTWNKEPRLHGRMLRGFQGN